MMFVEVVNEIILLYINNNNKGFVAFGGLDKNILRHTKEIK